MNTEVLKVGIREFRAKLPQYILTSCPVAITRHGETVGYYIPSHKKSANPDLDSLKQAAQQLEQLLKNHGLSEDELIAEFRYLKSTAKE